MGVPLLRWGGRTERCSLPVLSHTPLRQELENQVIMGVAETPRLCRTIMSEKSVEGPRVYEHESRYNRLDLPTLMMRASGSKHALMSGYVAS
jgi:hypothetical protein